MKHQLTSAIVFGLLTAGAARGAALAKAPATVAGEEARLALTAIDEHRRIEVVPKENDFTMNTPGLFLTFGIELREGRRVVELPEPRSVAAVDSTGRDLTQVEPNFFGRRQHIELKHTWGEAPKELTFKLALPDRAATSFDVSTTLEVLTDGGTRDLPVEVARRWKPLESELLPETVDIRLVKARRGVQLEMRPGTVRSHIESARIIEGGEPMTPESTMWNDGMVTYAFPGASLESSHVTLAVRVDLQTVPLELVLEKRPLP